MNLLHRLFAGKNNTIDGSSVSRAEVASLKVSACIAERIPQANDLASRLDMLAVAAARFPGISGALVAACVDDGRPLAHGSENLSLVNGKKPLIMLRQLTDLMAASDGWVELTEEQRGLFEISEDNCLIARSLTDGAGTVGLLVIDLSNGSEAGGLKDFETTLPCIAWVIRDSIKLEQTLRIEELRRLELDELGLLKPINTSRIATALKEIFCAQAVTILWREQGRLYLSATTEEKAPERPVFYDPGVGFAGYILETGKSILLCDATDRSEISEKLGEEVERSRGAVVQFPETLAESGRPFQMLAVPMLMPKSRLSPDQIGDNGNELQIHGVIRLLREHLDPPFINIERDVLQHFADLLGLAMLSAWRWILTEHILDAETEAICITRNDIEKDSSGNSVPRMVYCDPGAEALFGETDGKLRGVDARELYAKDEYDTIRSALNDALARGVFVAGPIRTRVKRLPFKGNVEVRPAEISYRLLHSPFVVPSAYYTIAVIRDITERLHLVEMLDSKGLAYFRSNKDGRTVETSKAECELTGYSEKELEGKPREDLYHNPADRKRLMARVRQAGGKFVHARERLKRKHDDNWFWAEGFVRLVKDRNQSEAGTEGLYEDVTDRIKLQGFLDVDPGKLLKGHELYSKLDENARFQLLFMTSLSHQLRSPLGALTGHLENFSKGITDASRFANHLKYCIGQARVCGHLVTNLTYMDRILRGEPFDFQRTNLTRLAIETKIDYESLADRSGIRLQIEDKEIDRLLPEVWGHDGLLRQVFINLFDNAIKYSTPNSTVWIRGIEGVGTKYLQISNEGFRIPRADRERIFGQGVRLPRAKAWISDGSGLGLWLVRKILDAHDAGIRCTEVYELGKDRTAFQISFPDGPVRRSVERRDSL
jgi:PAS domain S-box-containing protein